MEKFDTCIVRVGEFAGEKVIIIDDDYKKDKPYLVVFADISDARLKAINQDGGMAYNFDELEVLYGI